MTRRELLSQRIRRKRNFWRRETASRFIPPRVSLVFRVSSSACTCSMGIVLSRVASAVSGRSHARFSASLVPIQAGFQNVGQIFHSHCQFHGRVWTLAWSASPSGFCLTDPATLGSALALACNSSASCCATPLSSVLR